MSSVTSSAPALSLLNSRAALAAVAVAAIAVIVGPALTMQAIPAAAAPGDTVEVDFPYAPSGDQYEWIVPAGVTEVTIELAAGSGASVVGASGGPGGSITARVPVTPGQTLLVLIGAQGVTTPLMTGGQGSAVATADGDLLVVAGGGGASFRCNGSVITREVCGSGGAGGFSATSGTASGQRGSAPSTVTNAGTLSGPGESGFLANRGVPRFPRVVSSPLPASVSAGVLSVAPPTAPPLETEPVEGLAAGGGGGYYAAGHGGVEYDPSTDPDPDLVELRGGGGGGGSGFLVSGATLVSLENNVGNGFGSISYVMPASTDPDPTDPDSTPESESELAATGAVDQLGVAALAAFAALVLGALIARRSHRPELAD